MAHGICLGSCRLNMEAESEMLNLAGQTLTRAGFVKISLKNHLCLLALRKGCGSNYHLGTLVRTVFESFFLAQSGYGTTDLSVYPEVGEKLAQFTASCTKGKLRKLSVEASRVVGALLAIYDRQLEHAPLGLLVSAHDRAEENFSAAPSERKSLNTLVTMEQVRRMYESKRSPSQSTGMFTMW